MSTSLSDIFPIANNNEKKDSSTFTDKLNKYLFHWPLFVIGLLFTLTCGFIYYKSSVPYYTIKATVAIKDDKKEASEKDQLSELELSGQSKLAETELALFKSHELIAKVVNDLQLWATYQTKIGFKNTDLYDNSPVKITRGDSSAIKTPVTLSIQVKDTSSFFLINSAGKKAEFKFGEYIKSGFGSWKLSAQPNVARFINKTVKITLADQNIVAENYQKNIEAELPNKLAPIIEITLKDENERRGKDIIDHLIASYNQSVLLEKNQLTQKTLKFLDNRIANLAVELNSSDKAVEGFRSSNSLTDISSQSKVFLENTQSNDSKLNEVNIQLNIIDGIEQYINSSQNIQNASASLGVAYPALNSLIEKLSVLQSQREKLLATTPESNPMFEPIDRQIKSAKADIKDNIRNIKSSLLATKRNLQGFASKYESSIKDIPVEERQLVDKKRQQSTKETLYVYLLQKREQVSFNYASIVPDARIIDFAYADSAKAKSPVVIFGLAIFLGLVFPAGFIFGRTALKNRITTRYEIENATGTNVFGEFSYQHDAKGLVALDKENFEIGEQFRSFRTNLNILNQSAAKGWVCLFTSSIPNEGKSFVSSNLALVLAGSGKKVALLEMDLRKPKITPLFGLSATHPGISDYVAGRVPLGKIIQHTKHNPNLHIIGSGSVTEDPSELLENNEVSTLISTLKENYDYILIDTPPINLVTDAKILARYSNTIFYIIRQGFTYKSLLPFISELRAESLFGNMKVVFNGVEKGKYGYGYSYGNYYYQAGKNPAKKKSSSGLRRLLRRF